MRGFPKIVASAYDLEKLLGTPTFFDDAVSVANTLISTQCSAQRAKMGLSVSDIQGLIADVASPTVALPWAVSTYALKGQLHCHTTGSDGDKSPATRMGEYLTAGYDFAAITDHNTTTPDPEVSGIIFIEGREDTIDAAWLHYTRYTGYDVVGLAHPAYTKYYGSVLPSTPPGAPGLIDIYNRNCARNEEKPAIVDAYLSAGHHIWLDAVDDLHYSSMLNSGWVVVNCAAESVSSIMAAIAEGNFYASSGNDISFSQSTNRITASSAGLSTFTWIGNNGQILKTESDVQESSYIPSGNESYVRCVSVKASDGLYAWGQPIWVT